MSVLGQVAFAGVPSDLYAFHRYTGNSTTLPYSSKTVLSDLPRLSPGISQIAIYHLPLPLRPVIPINARTLRITAAAGTELASASSVGNVQSIWLLTWQPPPTESALQPSGLLHTRGIADQGFPHCPIFLLPPVGVWTVSQFQCGWPSSQTSNDRRLGRPYPTN